MGIRADGFFRLFIHAQRKGAHNAHKRAANGIHTHIIAPAMGAVATVRDYVAVKACESNGAGKAERHCKAYEPNAQRPLESYASAQCRQKGAATAHL